MSGKKIEPTNIIQLTKRFSSKVNDKDLKVEINWDNIDINIQVELTSVDMLEQWNLQYDTMDPYHNLTDEGCKLLYTTILQLQKVLLETYNDDGTDHSK